MCTTMPTGASVTIGICGHDEMKYAPGGDVNWLFRGGWRGYGAVIYGRKETDANGPHD